MKVKVKMLRRAHRGQILVGQVDQNGLLWVWPYSSVDHGSLPVGLAARNLKKRELIEFDPIQNTKDIIRQDIVSK